MTKSIGTSCLAWRIAMVAAVTGAGLILAACGGGDDDTPAAGTAAGGSGAVASESLASTDSFIALVQKLVASTDDNAEPLTLPAAASAPANDTTEPATTGT